MGRREARDVGERGVWSGPTLCPGAGVGGDSLRGDYWQLGSRQ